MGTLFPTDVSVRINGDRDAARELVGAARALLFRALLLNQKSSAPVCLTQRVGTDDFVSVVVIGDTKIVTLSAARRVPVLPEQQRPEFETPAPDYGEFLYVLCGMANGYSTVSVAGEEYLRAFRPIPATARAHKLPDAYKDNKRLGETGPDFATVKSSMFSGAMKRVVQAVQGLGRIKESSGYYLTAPTTPSRAVAMMYESNPYTTHGVYKAGPKNHWLVEISAARGVLAMPLPLIPLTRGAGYLKKLEKLGDVGGAAICKEFGGLPSGETFPSGSALAAAISTGKVLRLKTADDLAPYYGSAAAEARSHWESWAFSESGAAGANTRFVGRRAAGATKTSVYGQHWEFRLSLSTYTLNPPPGSPVGTGSISFSMLSEGKIARRGMKSLWAGAPYLTPVLGGYISLEIEDIVEPEVYAGFNSKTKLPANGVAIQDPFDGWGCAVHVFFDGERPIIVNWVPPFTWGYWSSVTYVDAQSAGDQNRGPFWTTNMVTGITASPSGFVCAGIDLRRLVGHVDSSIGTSVHNSYDGAGMATMSGIYHAPLPEGQAWSTTGSPTSTPVLFTATPTNAEFPIAADSAVQIDNYTNHYVMSSALYSRLNNTPNLGAGGGADAGRALCRMWAMVPSYCREGVVLARTYLKWAEPASSLANAVIFAPSVGFFGVPVDEKYRVGGSGAMFDNPSNKNQVLAGLPDHTKRLYYSVVANAGPAKAYSMTPRVAWQPERDGQAPVEPPPAGIGLLPDTGEVNTAAKITFVGSY